MKQLKLKYSSIIPFPGFYAITLFGCIFRNWKYATSPIPAYIVNHECIHACEAEDFCKGFIGYCIFYILYFIEWILKCIISLCTLFKVRAYRSISFEQEAYINEKDLKYQDNRKRFAWTKYIFKLVWKK